MHTLLGLKIVEDINMPVFSETPVKRLIRKPWMKERAYFKRVNKKWIARLGVNQGRPYIKRIDTIYCHPYNVRFIKDLLGV